MPIMNEELMTKLRAERMTSAQLRGEMARIDSAIPKATRPREVLRYERRRAIFAAELARREASAGQ